MRLLRRLLVLALFVAILVGGWQFAARNAAPVAIDLLFRQFSDIPLWTALLLAFAGGAGLVAVYAAQRLTRQGLVTRRYRKTVRGLESEVHQLRNLPLAGDPRAAGDEAPDVPSRGALERGS